MAIWPLNYKALQYHSTLGRLKCLSRQNSTIPLGTALALQQLFSSAAFLCCYTKQAIWMHNTFPLFFCTVWFSFHTGLFFFSPKHATKVILNAEGKRANSSMHSQGMPGSTHRPVLFKAAPVGLRVLSPAVYYARVLYLISAANNISTASPQEKSSSDNTLLPLVPCYIPASVSVL